MNSSSRRTTVKKERKSRSLANAKQAREHLQDTLLFEEFAGSSVREIISNIKTRIAMALEELHVNGRVGVPESEADFNDSLTVIIPIVVGKKTTIHITVLFSRSLYFDEMEDWKTKPNVWRAIISEIK